MNSRNSYVYTYTLITCEGVSTSAVQGSKTDSDSFHAMQIRCGRRTSLAPAVKNDFHGRFFLMVPLLRFVFNPLVQV